MTATAAARSRVSSPRAALPVLYLALSSLAFLFVGGRHPGASLWFPPAGVAFGYLLVRGWRAAWLVLLARSAGGLITAAPGQGWHPLASLATDAAVTATLVVAAELLRRAARFESPYALLTRFIGLGVVLAPVGAASAAGLLGAAHGHPLEGAVWARSVVGTATAVLTLTPAFLVLAAPWTAAMAPTRSVPARRRWELAGQALLIVLIPATSLLAGGADARELALLPVALVPLAWTAADPDRTRGAAVLAVAGLALGAAAELRFGDAEATFRLQLVMFAGALAALFAVAGLVADARARYGAEVETTRWRALVEAAPVAVARIGRDGRWRPEGAAGPGDEPDGDGTDAAAEILARAARVPGVTAAVAQGAPATVDWGVDDDTGRRFVTRVTPLPDGDTLAVTSETTRLHSAEVALAWERSHDRETDLPNRDLLLATADQALAEGRTASLVLVDTGNAAHRAVLLDLDPVRVLLVTAERLRAELDAQSVASGTALVARVGDGQFGVLLPEGVAAARDRAARMVRAVRAALPAPAGASAGVAALEPERGARAALQRAEAALQAAAELQSAGRGHGQVVVLDQLSVTSSAQRARLSDDVARAVERGELEVAFQPDVRLSDGRLTGVEALVRWRRRRGFAAPTDVFVQLAEEVGAVQGVDAWVMEEALRAFGGWRADHAAHDLELGLNVSALSLSPDLAERLVRACERHGVPPAAVRIEVTETSLADEGMARTVLADVKARGFRVALDDFGTGYATLARLHRLPVDVLKLDRSFLPAITEDEQARALVSLVLGLADALGMDVVAEGVETRAQRDVLVALGCRRAQGYLWSRPTSEAVIAGMLAAGGSLDEPIGAGATLTV